MAVELKTGKFLPEYVGKMQFYLAVLDDKVRMPYEASSIGIIILSVPQVEIREKKGPAKNKARNYLANTPKPFS